MLREVINKHIKPRVVPFQVTSTASTVTVNTGYGDYTATRTGTGAITLAHRQGFARNGLVLLGQGSATGSYAVYDSATNNTSSFPIKLVADGGAAADGIMEGICFGWDSTDLSLCKAQRVAATQETPRIIWGKVNGTTGAMYFSAPDFGVTKVSSGLYTITFKRSFARTPVVFTTAINTSSSTSFPIRVFNKTAAGCSVQVATETASPNDGDFYICAIGSDSRSDAGRGRMPLENTQRKPRIVAGQVTMTGGTPSISIGGTTGGADLISLTDNGTGDFSVTIAEQFAREPAIFLCTTSQKCQIHSYTSGAIRILTKNDAGDNTDVNGVTNIFIIGSDDATQY